MTLPRLARAIGVSIHTINKWKVRYDDFPEPRERVTSTMHLYAPRDFVGFLRQHPAAGSDTVRERLADLLKPTIPAG
jgi:transposase